MDIFAGSLPFKLKEDELKQLFEQYGEVSSAKIIIDKITRQNKGYGFVEMPNEAEAKNAIEALNGSEIMGRQIVVNQSEKEKKDFSRPQEKKNNFNKSDNRYSSKKDNFKQKDRFNNNRKEDFNRNRKDRYKDDE